MGEGEQITPLIVAARIWTVRLAFYAARLLPLRARVVLATAHSDHLEGNLACIRARLRQEQPALEIVELAFVSRPGLRGTLDVALGALRAGHLLATSRVIVLDDYFFPLYVIRPRSGTTVVQVWHACGAFKKFGYSLGDRSFGGERALAGRVRLHSNYDVCLVSSRSAAEAYADAFRQPLERFVWWLGVPKTDRLVVEREGGEARRRIRQQLGIEEGRRVIFYAPTFRGERTYDAHHPTMLDAALLRELLPEDVFLLRAHPFVRDGASTSPSDRLTLDLSRYPDVAELMLASDVLVTDYSSLIFDYSLLGRPIVLFAADHEAYERQRGFYFDYRREGPGPVFDTTRELGEYLRVAQFDLARVERFREEWFDVADGQATERIVDQLVLPALRGRPIVLAPPSPRGQRSTPGDG
jgi:teichoic acid ribitol-phosphate primase